MRNCISRLALILVLGCAPTVFAGSFSISPTRIELESSQRAAVVTIRNADNKPLTVQAQLVDWTQPEGEDVYTQTRDVLATPPVFTIPAGGEQIVRIAMRAAPDASREKAYRIFFQEIPAQTEATGINALKFALRIGVPIFVAPPNKPEGRLEWQVQRQTDGKLLVAASNVGAAHVQLTGFELSLAGISDRIQVEGMRYVLPGSRVSWTVDPPANLAAIPAGAWVVGSSDKGDFNSEAGVSPRL